MLQYEHRGFARDTRDFSEDELIGHQIAQHRHRDARERLHDADEPRA